MNKSQEKKVEISETNTKQFSNELKIKPFDSKRKKLLFDFAKDINGFEYNSQILFRIYSQSN